MPNSAKLKAKSLKTSKIAKSTSLKKVSSAKTGRLTVEVYSVTGRKAGTMTLPKEFFGAEVNDRLMAQAVRVYLANQRLGTANTKTRGEVKGSSRKIYRQKGTGRARHGAKSAPIFVGGGVAHGPRMRDYSLTLPQKMRKAALASALSLKASSGEIKVLSGLGKTPPKTKIMAQLFSKMTDDKKQKERTLLIASETPKNLENVYRAGRNIKNVEITAVKLLNTYEVLKHKNLLFMKEAVEVLARPTSNTASANAVKRDK